MLNIKYLVITEYCRLLWQQLVCFHEPNVTKSYPIGNSPTGETAAYCKELEPHFFQQMIKQTSVCVLFVENLETYTHYDSAC